MLLSQVITKEDLSDFTEEELFPVENITYTDQEKCGGYGPVTITLRDGSRRTIDFDQMEGQLLL